MESYGT